MLSNEGGVFCRHGRAFRHVGVNGYDLFYRYLNGYGDSPRVYRTAFSYLKGYGIKVCRSIINGPWPNEYDTYYNSPSTYHSRLLELLDEAAENDISIVLSFSPRWASISDRNAENIVDWTDSGSATRTAFADYVSDIVSTYKNHEACGAWELGNEWNSYIDGATIDLPAVSVPNDTLGSYSAPDDSLNEARYLIVAQAFVDACSGDTSNRLRISGNTVGRVPAAAGWPGYMPKALREHVAFNAICVHTYPDANSSPGNHWGQDAQGFGGAMTAWNNMAKEHGKILVVGEFGVSNSYSSGGSDQKQVFRRMINGMASVPLSLIWNVCNPAATTVGTTFAIWPGYNDWMLEMARSANF